MYYILAPLLFLIVGLLPLVTNVGRNLEYEYALLTSWLTLAFVPWMGIFSRRDSKRSSIDFTAALPPVVFNSTPLLLGWIFLVPLIFTVGPGTVLLWTKTCLCSPSGFYFWMAILWYPTAILAQAIAFGVAKLKARGWSLVRLLAFWIIALGLITIVTIAQLWLFPQKRLLQLGVGFLHGPIYDQMIYFDHSLAAIRLAHLLIAVALFAWQFRQRHLGWTVSLLVSLSAAAIITYSYHYGSARSTSVQQGFSALEEALPYTLNGDGFTLHFSAAGLAKPDSSKEQRQISEQVHQTNVPQPGPLALTQVTGSIRRLFLDTTFHLKELREILGAGQPVGIFVYPNKRVKKLWFGGGNTDVTDVRTPSIHITESSGLHPTLRHELVHAVGAKEAFHGLGFHPNMAFTEGLAVALAPEHHTLSLDAGAATLLASGKLPSLKVLFSRYFGANLVIGLIRLPGRFFSIF